MVRIRKVVERGQVDGKDTHGGASHGQCGYDIWDGGVGCPTEPKETDRHKSRFDTGEIKSSLRCWREEFKSRSDFVLTNAYDGSKNHANAHCWDSVSFCLILVLLLAVKNASVHTGEDGPCLLDVETVICLEHHRD